MAFTGATQLLEPRLLTNLPIGTNFLLAGYGYSTGRLLLDPTLPLDEDIQGSMDAAFLGYVRSIKVFEQSGKISIGVPFASGNWDTVINGQDSTRIQQGLGDINIRFSYNFLGSKALRAQEYASYQQNIISGISFQVYLPTGAYDADRAINIGSNRVRFRTVFGASKKLGNWLIEGYGAFWIFLPNNAYLGDNKLTQQPLAALKMHFIRTLPRGNWVTIDGGYGFGGRTSLNGEAQNVRISTYRIGITLAIPFMKRHNLRLAGYTGRSEQQGPDFDGLAAVYQYRWLKQ